MKQFYIRWEETVAPDLSWTQMEQVLNEEEARKLRNRLRHRTGHTVRNVEVRLKMNPVKYWMLYFFRFWWWERHEKQDFLELCRCGYSWPCPWEGR